MNPKSLYGGTVEVVNGWQLEKMPRDCFYSYAVDSRTTGFGEKFHSRKSAVAFAESYDVRAYPRRSN
jgi:hypothetical protein